MNLTKKQEEFLANRARYKFANWGRRSGKTTMFAYEALGTALSVDNARVTYYAPTVSDARDIAWGLFQEVFGQAVVKKNETLLELTILNKFGTTSLVVLRGWESVVIGEKGRGVENDLLIFDEVAFCRNFKEFWVKTLEPTLLTSKGRAVFASTPDGFNHWYSMCNEAQNNHNDFYSHATSYDNPFNDPVELQRIKESRTEDAFAQEYLADFRKTEGLVYKEFNRENHIFDDFTNKGQIIRRISSVDFGYKNPSAIYLIEVNYDNHYWISNEFYKTGKLNAELIEYIISMKTEAVYPDPAEPDRLKEMENAGLNVQEVSKDVEKGIDSVRNLFKTGRIHIHKECENLINELESYRYKEKRHGSNEPEDPIKENDHACDSIRYALYNIQPISYGEDENFSLYKTSYK